MELYSSSPTLGRECAEKPVKIASRGSQLPRHNQSLGMQDGHTTRSHSQARSHRYAPESAHVTPLFFPFCLTFACGQVSFLVPER
jgi:hypothetical protein